MLVHEKTRLRPISHWTFMTSLFCKVGLYYSSASINQLFNTKTASYNYSLEKLLWNVKFYLNQYFSQTSLHEIVRRNVKLTWEILNLDSKIKHLSTVYKKGKAAQTTAKLVSSESKKRTEHVLTLSPNLFFWASSTWCRRPKYFPYVHIYKAE